MKYIIITIFFVILLAPATLISQPFTDITGKTVFTKGYPQFFTFRGEMSNPNHRNYEAWKAVFSGTTGVLRKFVVEEFPALKAPDDVVNWANTYAQENPEMLMMLHYNGRCRTIEGKQDVLERYFPGHWVLKQGTILTSPVSPESTVINCAVVNNTLFNMTEYRDIDNGHLPPYLLLIPFDSEGNKLWYESEFVRLTSVNTNTKQITVDRGQLYSTPKNFTSGTYIAALPGQIISQQPLFFYNMASTCPVDLNGKKASDLYVEELSSYFNRGNGLLKNFNGIAFDVNYFDVSNSPNFDVNNDGIADGGIINGVNLWREGNWEMLRNLRQKLGNEYIISADGHHATNQQAVGILNGIESEGLVQHNDAWRGISRTLNTHLYWRNFNETEYYFSYVVLKFMHDNDASAQHINRLTRFGIATAVCLKAHLANYPSDITILPEWMRETGALGFADGPLVRLSQSSPERLGWSNANLRSNLKSEHGSFTVSNQGVLFTPNASATGVKTTWTLNNVNLPAGDITLFLEAIAIDPLEGFQSQDAVPRNFHMQLTGLPDYGEGNNTQQLYSNLYGYFGTKGFSDMSFYYRRPGIAAGNQNITFDVQGNGKVLVRNIRLYNEPDIFGRAFEKGVVIVNPSLEPVTINPISFFPGYGITENMVTIPAVDAVFLSRTDTVNNIINNVKQTPAYKTFKINGGVHQLTLKNQHAVINIMDLTGKTIKRIEANDTKIQLSLPKDKIYIIQIID